MIITDTHQVASCNCWPQSSAFQLLRDDSFNFLKDTPPGILTLLRKQTIEMVLGTDMKQVSETNSHTILLLVHCKSTLCQ